MTILEMVVTVAVLSVAIVAILGALGRATTTATFAQKRNEALDDLRLMAATFGKDVRQGVAAAVATPTQFSFSTYVDGDVEDVVWRAVTGGAEGDRLERVVNGGTSNVFVIDLTTRDVFSYFDAPNAASVSRVRLSLYTVPDDRSSRVRRRARWCGWAWPSPS